MENRYADESEPSWYTGRRHAAGPGDPEVSGAHSLPDSAYRLPEQRDPIIPVRGPEYPTIKPPREEPARDEIPAVAEPTTLVPPVAAPNRPPDGVYRTRRPVSSVILAIVAAVLLLPALRLLLSATFAGDPTARGIVPAVLLTLGLPLTALGIFAAGSGPGGRDAWLRAPLAYLPAGLVLLLAAGLAVA